MKVRVVTIYYATMSGFIKRFVILALYVMLYQYTPDLLCLGLPIKYGVYYFSLRGILF